MAGSTRGQVDAGTSVVATDSPTSRSTSRAQSARDTAPRLARCHVPAIEPAPMSSTIASARSVAEVGEPTSSATSLSGSAAARARSAAARIFIGKSLPGGPYSQAVRAMASAAPGLASNASRAATSPASLLAP